MKKTSLTIFAVLFLGLLMVTLPIYLAEASTLAQTAQEGEVLFKQKCVACHTIGGGRLVGPDLLGVTQRRELSWLKSFIATPDQLIASGDPTAAALLKEYNNVPMPNLGLKPTEVDALVAYLEATQAAGQAPVETAPQAMAPGNVQAGRALFTGGKPLQNEGGSCIACHSSSGVGALGGGALGPDLTQVYRRYTGPGLSAALNTIAFPTMQGPFLNKPLTPQEQADLVAFFQWTDANSPDPAVNGWILFLAAGLLGALVLFGIMAFFWPRQRQNLASRLRAQSRTTYRGELS